MSRPHSVHVDEFKYVRSLTDKTLKFTLPGPMTICDTIADAHYGRRADMAMAFAELLNDEAKELVAAGADIIQFDEPAFNVFFDDVNEWGIDTLHRAIEGLDCTTAVHICYGYGIEENIRWKESLGDEWRQYEKIFPALNASRVDQISLECAELPRPALGHGHLERQNPDGRLRRRHAGQSRNPKEVAATIRSAMEYVDPERILPCTNCGMTPIPYDIALGKLTSLAAGAGMVRSRAIPDTKPVTHS